MSMLRPLPLFRVNRQIICRQFSSDDKSVFLSNLLGPAVWKSVKPLPQEPIEDGSSRFWELGNPRNQYACIGATAPVNLEKLPHSNVKLSKLIDYGNQETDRLHIKILKCPRLLADRILQTFPGRNIKRENLRIIKLSYNRYIDQSKGQLDCLIAANHICKLIQEDGDFGFYSGAAAKDAQNGIFFHVHRSFTNLEHQHTTDLHVSLDSKNGCINIDHLSANDVGVIYTDCVFDIKSVQDLMQRDNC